MLKPIDKDDLIEIVNKLSEQAEKERSVFKDRLAVKDAQGTEFIEFSDIRTCEASNNYSIIHLSNGEQKIVSKTLKAIQSELPSNQFVRIHQSYIINVSYIKKYLKSDGGTVELDNGLQYRISKGYRDQFLSMIR